MIQFNLLPDVKLEYIKTRRRKRLVILLSTVVSGAAIAAMIIMFMIVKVWQRATINALTKDIASNVNQTEQIPDIRKILTVQSQLNALDSLHNQKPISSHFFTYMRQLTPANVSITRANVDFTLETITLTGVADSLQSVNKFVDTIKFTDYAAEGLAAPERAFDKVVLQSFTTDESRATYAISFTYKKNIFDATVKNVTLQVPKLTTTRSELPNTVLFGGSNDASEVESQQ